MTEKKQINELADIPSLIDPVIREKLKNETLDQWSARLIDSMARIEARVNKMQRNNNSILGKVKPDENI